MSNRCRGVCALVLILVLSQSPALADGHFELPPDLQKLLPANPSAVVAFSSVNDLARDWNRVAAMMAEEDLDKPADMVAYLSDQLPRFEEMVDPERPMLLAMDMAPVIMGQEPYVTYIMPLNASFTDRQGMGPDLADMVVVFADDYAALSTNPGYQPATEVPALAGHLLHGVMSASLDLEGVLATYGSMVEMSLAAIPVAAAEPDTTAAGELVPAAGMTQEEVDALKTMIQALIQSARRLDLSLGTAGDQLHYAMQFTVIPGSPLESGPQPPFGDALALTSLLPAGEDILQVIAIDQTRQYEVFRPFYMANMKREAAKLDPEKAATYETWFQEYMTMIDLWAKPLASALRVSEDGMAAHVVIKTADAAADLDRVAAMLEGLSATNMGIRLLPQETLDISGAKVRNWVVEYDEAALKGFAGTPTNPQLTGLGRMQAEQMSAFLRKVVPGIHLAAKGDHLFISAENGTDGLAHMISGGAGGNVHAGAARTAKIAGPAVQQVINGDLMAILNWVTDMMEELDSQERDTIAGNPIPFSGALTVAGPTYGFGMAMDMEAMGRLVKTVAAMDPEEEDPAPGD